METCIAILDSDRSLLEQMENKLNDSGYDAFGFFREDIYRQFIIEEPVHLFVIERKDKNADGLKLLQELREKLIETPVILISGSYTSDYDRIQGFAQGCDDYLVKPFGMQEFLLRCRAILNRSWSRQHYSPRCHYRDLAIDTEKNEVSFCGKPIDVSPLQYRLLLQFLSNSGKTLSREYLIETCWKDNMSDVVTNNAIKAAIKRLKEKVFSSREEYIKAVRGVGYIMV